MLTQELYPCLLEKILLNYELTELWDKNQRYSTWWVFDLYWRGLKANFESGIWSSFSALHYCLTCVNKVSHLCYWSTTINDPCLKEVDGELRVALSNIEPNLQRLFSFKQAQITENNSWSKLFAWWSRCAARLGKLLASVPWVKKGCRALT